MSSGGPLAVQLSQMRATLDQLNVLPSFDLPRIDPSTLAFVYPIDPAFINEQPLFWRTDNVDINAVMVSIKDDGSGTVAPTFDIGSIPNLANFGRSYSYVRAGFTGGAVTPIHVQVILDIQDAGGVVRAYIIAEANVANPGHMIVGPVYCPPGVGFRIDTTTNGGIGDLFTIRAHALRQAKGVAVPLVQPLDVRLG